MNEDREMLSVAEFERTMCERGKRFDAQFAEMRTLITSGFGGVHARQDVSNGRLAKVEELAARTHDDGCARLEMHRAMLDAAEPAPRRWHQRPAVQGAGGTGIVLGLIELVKLIVTHRW